MAPYVLGSTHSIGSAHPPVVQIKSGRYLNSGTFDPLLDDLSTRPSLMTYCHVTVQSQTRLLRSFHLRYVWPKCSDANPKKREQGLCVVELFWLLLVRPSM